MFESLRKLWEELAGTAKAGLIAGAAIILVATIGLGVWALSGDYKPLFTDLEPRDAASIVAELERMKVPYKLDKGGATILVDEDEVYSTRLKLMGKGGVLSGGVGFEIFDESDIGMTEYAQKISYQRALQGELARTISSFQEVKFARVHLVMPETSIFKQQQSQTKGSVSLILREGATLSEPQVRGIQRLVAAAVPNLTEDRVTVLDQRGITLSQSHASNSELATASQQLKVKTEVEDYLARKVVEVLDRTFGPGRAIVSVDATINLDHVKSTLEDVLPAPGDNEGAGVVVRKRQSIQRDNGVTAAANGVAPAAYKKNSLPTSSTTEIEYEFGKRIEQVVSTPGGIKRLSIGVLVPDTLDSALIDNVREIVSMAVGLNVARGDAIAVHSLADLHSANDAVQAAEPAGETPVTMAAKAAPKQQDGERAAGPDRLAELVAVLRNFVTTQPYVAAGLGVLVVALCIAFIALLIRVRRTSAQTVTRPVLSERERELLLADIKQWISMEAQKFEGGSKA